MPVKCHKKQGDQWDLTSFTLKYRKVVYLDLNLWVTQ